MTRQKLILAVLLLILALAFWYAYWASPRQERVASAVGSQAKVKRTHEVQTAPMLTDKRRVRLEILERGIDAFSEPRRDIFRLVQPRPIVATPPPRVTVPQPTPPPVSPPVQVVSPALVPQAAVRFTALGYLEKEKVKTVFLSLENEIFIVKEGDLFGKNKEFEAEEITDEKIVIRHGSGTFPITIPLIDTTPSAPSSPAPSRMSTPPVGRSPGNMRPTRFRPPPIPTRTVDEDQGTGAEEDSINDTEEVDQNLEDLEAPFEEDSPPEIENPTEETEPGKPAAGNTGMLPMRSML